MNNVMTALGNLGYLHLEPVADRQNRWSLTDRSGRHGQVVLFQPDAHISSDSLAALDQELTDCRLEFLIILHGITDSALRELVETWDFACETTAITVDELLRQGDDISEPEAPPENAADLLKKPGESHLGLLNRMRPRLLDLSLRNPLLNFRGGRGNTVPIIDELPRLVVKALVDGKSMRLDPAPEPEEPPTGSAAAPSTAGGQTKLQLTVHAGEEGSPPKLPAAVGLDSSLELPADPGIGAIAARHRDLALQTPLTRTTLGARMGGILRDQDTAVESTGTNPLHLAIGFLHWFESPDETKDRLAPLLLLPVTITRVEVTTKIPLRKGDEGWDPRGPTLQKREIREFQYSVTMTGEEPVTNECLMRKMAAEFNIVIPRLPADTDEGEAIDPEEYFLQVATAIARMPTDKRWKVRREISLGFFSFVKLLEWQDLDPANWKPDPKGLLERLLSGQDAPQRDHPSEDVIADEFHLSAPVPVVHEADSSQTAVLARANAGEDLVVQGPPGTGKTQTITNLIANAIGSGKRVLFVAEKMAALNAAREKLEAAGLSEFCLELHSHKATPATALKALKDRLERTKERGSDLSALRGVVRPSRDALNAYAAAIANGVGHNGERVDQILWKSNVANAALLESLSDQADIPRLAVPPDQVIPPPVYHQCVQVLAGIAELVNEHIPRHARPWKDFRPTRFLGTDDATVCALVSRLIDQLQVIPRLHQAHPDFPGWTIPLGQWRALNASVVPLRNPPTDLLLCVAKTALGKEREVIKRAVDRIQLLRKVRNDSKSVLAQLSESGDYTNISRTLADLIVRGQKLATKQTLTDRLTGLQQVAERLDLVRKALPSALATLKLDGELTWRHLPVLQGLMQALASADGPSLLQARLLRGSTRAAIVQGQKTNESLATLRARLDRAFVLEDLPKDDDLRQLRQVLRAKPHPILAFIGLGPLAKARRRLRAMVRNQEAFEIADPPTLIDWVLDLRKREQEFNDDRTLAHEIGPSFAGCRTAWPRLATISEVVHGLSTVFGVDQARASLELLASVGVPTNDFGTLEESLTALIAVRDQPAEVWSMVTAAVRSPTASLSSAVTEIEEVVSSVRRALGFISELGDGALAGGTLQAISGAIAEVASIRALATAAAADEEAKAILGTAYSGAETVLEPIVSSLEWTKTVMNSQLGAVGAWILSEDALGRLASARAICSGVSDAMTGCAQTAGEMAKYGAAAEGGAFDLQRSSALPRDVIPALVAASAAGEHLRGWSRWCELSDSGSSIGLTPLISAAESGVLSSVNLRTAFDADVYGRLAREVVKKHPPLRDFDRGRFDALRDRFREDDRSLIKHGRAHISSTLLSVSVPQGVAGTRVADLTDLRLILHEIPKSRAHVPIRQLIKRAMPALQALAPCLMMSPLSVAQFLPRVRGMFDLVIMDEASQIRPEDAFGALLRGKQAIVVGDEKQMPPSNIFQTGGADSDGSGLLAGNAVSILELAHVALPRGRAGLRWHYRSQHESLIQFSNSRYYDNRLVIFPSRRLAGPDVGIHFVHTPEGRFLGGINRVEAEAVVKAVLDHAKRMLPRKPEHRESLLVVTMNSEQNKLVNELVDTAALQDPQVSLGLQALRDLPERLMIKNLENVQGDERDRVIIGFTYGKEPQSEKVRQHFGPINQSGGERRLNVLFSRAKRSITIISSMLAEHIIPGGGSARGVHDLKDYLAFAATGGIPDRGVVTRRKPDSDFELAVGDAISRLGYTPVYQVGVANYFIDIGIIDPKNNQEYILGVECDGATYHSSRCARDRDRLRQDIIESRGWKVHRIWSTSWFRDRFSEERRLQMAIQQAMKG